jgi:predicted nucleic acid-binding protein
VSHTIFLDASPLGLVTKAARTPEVTAIHDWVDAVLAAGHRIVVPAIADFEVRRELERSDKLSGLARLDAFNAAEPDRYLPLSDAALRRAATLWAQARRQGRPTADRRELDCDVVLAAQALTASLPPGGIVVATTNIGHLAQFLPAENWTNITP